VHTEFRHQSDIHEQASVKCLCCACSDKQNICAVAVDVLIWGEVISNYLRKISGDEVRTDLFNVTFCSAVCFTQNNNFIYGVRKFNRF